MAYWREKKAKILDILDASLKWRNQGVGSQVGVTKLGECDGQRLGHMPSRADAWWLP